MGRMEGGMHGRLHELSKKLAHAVSVNCFNYQLHVCDRTDRECRQPAVKTRHGKEAICVDW